MPISAWDKLPSETFGFVWVPLVTIQLRALATRYWYFTAVIDSGAVISVLRRSSADQLGLEFASGKQAELGSVGQGRLRGRVHEIATRFETGTDPVAVPFLIAESEDVPNLLGRLGVFDRFEITFDPQQGHTRVRGPFEQKDRT